MMEDVASARPAGPPGGSLERSDDGATTTSWDVSVAGDHVERLMIELFDEHWGSLTVGPIIEGAAYEIRFTEHPKISMLDGYLTVDTGPWHFHLCVNDHRGASSAEQSRVRRVARAAFFRAEGGGCVPGSWGLQLWNGRGEQMITVLFPNPYLDETMERRTEPDWTKTALWEDLRSRYTAR